MEGILLCALSPGYHSQKLYTSDLPLQNVTAYAFFQSLHSIFRTKFLFYTKDTPQASAAWLHLIVYIPVKMALKSYHHTLQVFRCFP